MIRLNEEQIQGKIEFIDQYIKSYNAADGSKLDANANVTMKNIATLEAEINKDIQIQLNRSLVSRRIESLFGGQLASEYQRQIEAHEIYVHDETSLKPYCVSVTMYPLLLDGLTRMGGESKAPKNLSAFCGIFVNFVFAISSQFAGAVATVEFLTYFDYFARLEFGVDYLKKHRKQIEGYFQQVVYSINQPAAARGYQSVFWNISIYDQFYFQSIFENFFFPNGERPQWESVNELQKYFMSWFNCERTKAILTFPVVTAALLTENRSPRDMEFKKFLARELSEGNSFFIYQSDSPDSLASCCRLRNEVSMSDFSYSLGAGGVATGSLNVITINMNRLIQDGRDLRAEVEKIHRYQVAYKSIMEELLAAGMLTAYDAGFIQLDKQYLTIGINGMVEAAEYLGIEVGRNREYQDFVTRNLKTIYGANREAAKFFGHRFNTEFVPAENLGIKNANWDKKDGYKVSRDCYNSYFYIVEDFEINPLDKFYLHGDKMTQYLDGGSALHLNLEEYLDEVQYSRIIDLAARTGCNYFCTNVLVTICNDCNFIDKRKRDACSKCHSKNIDLATRVIGYLKRVSSFSRGRRAEHSTRNYHLVSRPKVQNFEVSQGKELRAV